MKLRISLLYLVTTLVVFGSITPKVFGISPSSVQVSIIPPSPAPQENTRIDLNSYADNLDTALISWSIDGKTSSSGIGKKTFSLTAPALGKETIVIATISLSDSTTTETKITIKPSVMVLLWQTNNSYAPPFYKGKILPSEDAEIKVVAMPEIRNGSSNVSPMNLTYYWKYNYTNDQEASGYGKNFYVYTNDYLEDSNNVSVSVATIDQKYSSNGNISITPVQPKILFYKNDSEIGTIWQKTIPDLYKIKGSEIIDAEPYFISPKEIQSPTLAWSWFINDSRVTTKDLRKNLMPLQVQEGAHGTSKLKLSIENRESLSRPISKEVSIEF